MSEIHLESVIGPRGPRTRRSNSALPTITTSIPTQENGSKQKGGKSSSHRYSRSMHHSAPYHLLSHHNSRRDYGPLVRENPSEMITFPENSRTDMSRRMGKLKDHSLTSSSSQSRRDAGGVVKSAVKDVDSVPRAAQLAREQQRLEARSREVQTVYQNVSNISMESTRKLDDIYYSVLERLSSLRSTVSSLQELSIHNGDLQTKFDDDAQRMHNDITKQVETYDDFEEQQAQIVSLESRIKKSKGKTDTLTKRLEAARERVQILETQEAEVQASISFQFRIVWFILGALITSIIALLVAHFFIPISNHESWISHRNDTSLPIKVPQTSSPTFGSKKEVSASNLPAATTTRVPIVQRYFQRESTKNTCTTGKNSDDDPRLRLFEEL